MLSNSNEKQENKKHKSPCREELTNREGTWVLHHFGNILLSWANRSRSIYLIILYTLHTLYFIFVCVKYFIKKQTQAFKGGRVPKDYRIGVSQESWRPGYLLLVHLGQPGI